MSEQHYQHWSLAKDNDNILWLTLDRQDASVNTLNRAVIEEFNHCIEHVAQDRECQGLIIRSGKDTGFIAGADVEQFGKIKDINEAVDLVRQGQKVLDRLAALSMPTVAMIEGFCLGGGLELSLACRYRVAENSRKTRLGLPEVLLGIHPGWGGTVRLPQLIGILPAMDLILSGRTVSANAAAKMGVVDAAVPKRQLERAARYYVLNKPPVNKPSKLQRVLNFSLLRPLLAKLLRSKVAKKASPKHYPAPYAVIHNWVRDGAHGEKAMINEANSIGKMLVSDTSRNLVRVFFLQERLKSLGKDSDFAPQHVHVIGAGVMGGDIAAWCALRGMRVTLQDREPQYIAPAIKRAYALFKKKLRKPRDINAAMDRLMPDTQGLGVSQADVIIEAIYENLEAKQALFKELEINAKPTAILASNTSSIPLDEINTVMQNPSRLVGIHFFNPVAMMPLVEIVVGNKSDTETIQSATAFVRKIDRLPIPVKSSPGFLVNRVLMAYLMEAFQLYQEGVPMAAIDKAAKDFGMPMGPIELADTVGLDICLSVAKNLTSHLGGEVPEHLVAMVDKGQLGKKSGSGFYDYKKGKPVKRPLAKNYKMADDITKRMSMRLLNESAAVLREGVVEDADLLDAGMIFGTGFAPFTGGPMSYAKFLGKNRVLSEFARLSTQYGERFLADPYWSHHEDGAGQVQTHPRNEGVATG
ncbi:MAG: crotonase [Legionellales bacterium]|nr:crotonase [Legionellales bacterium]|tara:strand:+ start:3872 stop:5962 length:2091 start_codon:yes stop_codon:yes gene_type:complete